MGVTIKPHQSTITAVTSAYLGGARLVDIAEELGTSAVTIRNWLIKAGVTLRTRAETGTRYGDRTCLGCGAKFPPANSRHRTCDGCTPTKAARHRFRRYGITQPQYEARLEAQSGRCPLCLVLLKLDIDTCVDHCHRTGRVRGILCRGCNMVASRFEDEGFTERAKAYLGIGGRERG